MLWQMFSQVVVLLLQPKKVVKGDTKCDSTVDPVRGAG